LGVNTSGKKEEKKKKEKEIKLNATFISVDICANIFYIIDII